MELTKIVLFVTWIATIYTLFWAVVTITFHIQFKFDKRAQALNRLSLLIKGVGIYFPWKRRVLYSIFWFTCLGIQMGWIVWG